jgi:hypothetical protein
MVPLVKAHRGDMMPVPRLGSNQISGGTAERSDNKRRLENSRQTNSAAEASVARTTSESNTA